MKKVNFDSIKAQKKEKTLDFIILGITAFTTVIDLLICKNVNSPKIDTIFGIIFLICFINLVKASIDLFHKKNYSL